MKNADVQHMSRRHALGTLAATLGLAALTPALVKAASARPGKDDAQPSRFTAADYDFLSRLCDLIIPATDTPGALAAGVPAFLSYAVANTFSAAQQQTFLQGLQDFQAQARQQGQAFSQLPVAQQQAHLAALDAKAFGPEPYPWSEFYKALKALILFGYYTSEPGATKELNYAPVPGIYQGCVPLETVGRAWVNWGRY